MKYLTPELIIDSLLEDNITRDDAVKMVKEWATNCIQCRFVEADKILLGNRKGD